MVVIQVEGVAIGFRRQGLLSGELAVGTGILPDNGYEVPADADGLMSDLTSMARTSCNQADNASYQVATGCEQRGQRQRPRPRR